MKNEGLDALVEVTGSLIVDDDGDICIMDGRTNNSVFCPAVDEQGEVLNPDVVSEIVRRFNSFMATEAAMERAASEDALAVGASE